jgi:hypothetical protein
VVRWNLAEPEQPVGGRAAAAVRDLQDEAAIFVGQGHLTGVLERLDLRGGERRVHRRAEQSLSHRSQARIEVGRHRVASPLSSVAGKT